MEYKILTMNELEGSPILFVGDVNLEDIDELSEKEKGWENAATSSNPHRDDDRRLFQMRAVKFF